VDLSPIEITILSRIPVSQQNLKYLFRKIEVPSFFNALTQLEVLALNVILDIQEIVSIVQVSSFISLSFHLFFVGLF